ncbi:MAG: HNH endonuclease [Myxococcota bacterium]|nr:HNH endonuclease [Myxococcota bacterium]
MLTQLLAPTHSQGSLAGRVRRRSERPGAPRCSVEGLQALDAELARRAGEAGRLRFEMGRGLDLLEQSGGHHALGFSSIEAYALERCERSASWTQKARSLARRLEAVPALAEALISGSLSWSMAAVLATVASPDDAEFWLTEASRRTVREMKALVLERRGVAQEGETLEAGLRTLTLTVPREDAWCFEHAKLLGRHLGERTNADFVLGLVAESTSTLCSELPSTAIELPDDEAMSPQRGWERELARLRTEAEERCESHFRRSPEPRPHVEPLVWPEQPEAVDRQLRELSRELVGREVAFGRALDAFFAADGWRRLGYATAAQYARERLGTSLSSVKAKRRLVKRLGQLRFLADAVDRGGLGYEAARLVAEVATGTTVEGWVARASERTLRHLREEIDSAELLSRWSESTAVLPPSEAEARRVQDLERAVVTGQISAPPALPPTAGAPLANVTLHLHVHASTARDFRHWEAIYLRHRGSALRDTTFLRFACELFLDTWRARGLDVEYAHIYERDRHRCQSPCCGRRDVTPHHLRFRSHGGDDSDENLTSLCTWCHLEGIHRGQISATPPASNIRWTFGRSAHTVVEGRRRTRAGD